MFRKRVQFGTELRALGLLSEGLGIDATSMIVFLLGKPGKKSAEYYLNEIVVDVMNFS